jgi:hypothetical protein
MTIDIPGELRDEEYATRLVKRYLATDSADRARYSGAYFERLGGGGDRPETAFTFTAEDLLAVSMLSVHIDGYHALHVLHYQARELNDLLAAIPPDITPDRPPGCRPDRRRRASPGIVAGDLRHPSPEYDRAGSVAAGKLLARKRPQLIPVYDSRVKKVLSRPRIDRSWWHDLRAQLIKDRELVCQLKSVRRRAGAGRMSLLRVFEVMCWMFSWEDRRRPAGGPLTFLGVPGQVGSGLGKSGGAGMAHCPLQLVWPGGCCPRRGRCVNL